MKFTSRKDTLFSVVFGSVCLLMLGVVVLAFVDNLSLTGLLVVVGTSVLVIGLMLWIYLATYYEINNDILHYRSGPLKGNIAISEINTIIRGKTLWVGIKPATARKGLIINYERFNEIYISPEREALFLKMLLAQNPSIKIIEASENPVY
jgi:hypothetical protein